MDRVVFGDNQFFGINHMSQTRAREQARRFASLDAILNVLHDAYDCGIRGFMFSTHERVRDICKVVRADRSRFSDCRFYPVIPYAHKYANAVAEKGVVGALVEATAGNRLQMLATGGLGVLKQDPVRLMRVLVDAELGMFGGLDLGGVFLQNIVTDLMLGLGQAELLAAFSEYVQRKYHVPGGFITMNVGMAIESLRNAGLEQPVVCASFNPVGYLMFPSREAVERTVVATRPRVMAMSVLASGAVRPESAAEYLGQLRAAAEGAIESVVYGASSRRNIEGMLTCLASAGFAP